MAKHPRYTTFQPGELETCLRELDPQASFSVPVTGSSLERSGGRILLKSHSFTVTFPDGQSGTCRYERIGPRCHRFHYRYADGASMPTQTLLDRIGNDVGSIEQKGQEKAASCYQEAIRAERDYHFKRATEPSDGSRKKCPERYRMKAERAKALAGLYALSQPCNGHLLVVSPLFDSIEKANTAWREQGDLKLVVGCCNRLDRCWDLPKFNPLYAEHDPRPAFRKEPEEAEIDSRGAETRDISEDKEIDA